MFSHISIIGVPGVGKSYIIDKLRDTLPQYKFINEPVDEWVKSGMLEKYYKDKKKYALEFQTYVLDTWDKQLKDYANFNIITERDQYSNYIFAEVLYETNFMTEQEWEQYLDHFYKVGSKMPNIVIYIDSDLDIILSRIKERNRKGEETITKSYLEDLKKKHDEYFELSINKIKINNDNGQGWKQVESFLKNKVNLN